MSYAAPVFSNFTYDRYTKMKEPENKLVDDGPVPDRTQLIASKLSPPLPSPFEVTRDEICDQVFAAGSARLVLLRAPAGFGKTTVMLQVLERLRQSHISTSWLTLDGADNDIGRFLSVLSATMDRMFPKVRQPSGKAQGGIALQLLDRMSTHAEPFALFLDDFETIQNPAVVNFVRELIDQLPRGGQLIVGSRGVPDLALGRLRARGHLLEVTPAQLRFSIEETGWFLNQRRMLALGGDDVGRLHHVTEGWPAALWLASVSLQGREQSSKFIAQFSGSNFAVAEYLLEDVVSRLPERLSDFLLRTSVLNLLTAPVCDHICGCSDSAELLRQLERANLFLIPLNGDNGWYRYHSLFADFLRYKLEQRFPAEIPRLHRAASEWFLEQGRYVPAIEHALSSGDTGYAMLLLGRHAETLLAEGRVRLLTRWLDPLAAAGNLEMQPLLQVMHAWAVMFTRGAREAMSLLEAFDTSPAPNAAVAAHRLVIRPTLLALMDKIEEAYPLAVDNASRLDASAEFPRAFMANSLANTAICAGHYDKARSFLDAARKTSGGSFNSTLTEATEAAIDLIQGRLRQATARLLLATSPTKADSVRSTNGNGMAGILLAEALYEADDCEQAERLLNVYVPLTGNVIPDNFISSHILLARIAAGRGDLDRAFYVLTELECLGNRAGLPRSVASAKLERSRLALAQGQAANARQELDRAGDAQLWQSVSRLSLRANEVETRDLGLMRWNIRAGRPEQTIERLTNELNNAERAFRMRRALTLRVLLAEALWRSDQRSRSLRLLGEALAFAEAEGYVRVFIDEGETVAVMLGALREQQSAAALNAGFAKRSAMIERIQLASRRGSDASTSPSNGPASATELCEPLTRKEMNVLQLLAQGLSNPAIAERLFVAETTVRTHLRSITIKFDAHNRTEIIAIARRLGLVD